MVRFGEREREREREREIAKKKSFTVKRSIKYRDVNVDGTVISKLVKTKTNSKSLIGFLDKTIRSLI